MESPVWFVLIFICFLVVFFLVARRRHYQELALGDYLKGLPERAIFPEVSFYLWDPVSFSLGKSDIVVVRDGFLLTDGMPDYFFTRPNRDLRLPFQTVEWLLKSITVNGKQLVVTAATNELNYRFETYHFKLADPVEAEQLALTLEKFGMKVRRKS